MSLFFIKSILALAMVVLAVIAMISMLEVLGIKSRDYDTLKTMTMHRWAGRIYFIIFAVVTYYCLVYIASSRAELTARSALHGTTATLIVVLMGLKLLFMKRYREFYSSIKYIGILMVVLTFVMSGSSGGYYLVVSKFGTDSTFDKIIQYKQTSGRDGGSSISPENSIPVKIDRESKNRGKKLFDAKCIFCHDPESITDKVGPGLKGIMQNDVLPASGRPADPVNIINQLRKPLNRMPSFEYLTEEEVADVLSYLNTL